MDEFHFIRKEWLWAMIPLLFLTVLTFFSFRERNRWQHLIAASLRPYMIRKGNRFASLGPLLTFLLGGILMVLALAGPSWQKKKVPGAKTEAVLLIGLDLSSSMLVDDLQPNRLERAKFKIQDLLDENPVARTGLFAFAGTSHTVVPFTSDYSIVKHYIETLEPRIMPVQGRNFEILMQVVDTLMQDLEAPSTLLLLTDELSADESSQLQDFVGNTPHSVDILLMATANGGKVPGLGRGKTVVAKPDMEVINGLSGNEKIRLHQLTLDSTDVRQIAKRVRKNLTFQQSDKEQEEWEDMGLWFLVPVLLIVLFWFRRGWVLQSLLPILFILGGCSAESPQADWWYTADYQGQLLYQEGKFEEAAEKFEDLSHQAAAYYKAGNYEAAAALYAMDSSANGDYNRGLALAKLGRYNEAMEAFDQAEEKDPALSQAATSKQQLEKAMIQMDSIARFDQKKGAKKEGSLKERKPESPDEELTSDTQTDELPKDGERATDEQETGIRKVKEMEDQDMVKDIEAEPSGGQQLLIQKAPADPAGFLQKRFRLQQKRYFKDVKQPKEQW
ncbi:VWA domain-containing protein [Limibacter armeniacum]|uniref:VWA domain-containing protein n=1 Tax=Limibacter armeniacum TaxID=466084 RepID=UPI002FE5D926